jgi:hypothetical protein
MASYLQSYLPKEAVPAETSSASISEPAAPEAGMKRVKKKGEGEEEELFSVKGKGGKKGKKGGAKKDDKPAVVKIQHSIDTIAAFGKLKVTVPLATDAVTATIEALKVELPLFLPDVFAVACGVRRAMTGLYLMSPFFLPGREGRLLGETCWGEGAARGCRGGQRSRGAGGRAEGGARGGGG